MVEINLQNTDVSLDVAVGGGSEKFAYKTDMVVGNLSAKPEVALKDSELVFVGYGVNAPEQQWNDYAGLDVKGKTVVVLINDPGFGSGDAELFKGRAMTYYGRWTYKFEEAARQGAAGALIGIHAPQTDERMWKRHVESHPGAQRLSEEERHEGLWRLALGFGLDPLIVDVARKVSNKSLYILSRGRKVVRECQV